jgi:putative endopeptidase
MVHGGLGLPEREYYRRTDGEFPNIRREYEAHIARLLTLAGQSNTAAQARRIVALETQIAERHWPIADRRNRDRTYNLKTRAEIRALAPRFPWDAAFDAQGLGAVQEVVISELSAMGPLANLYVQTPVSTWKSYLTYHLIRNNSPILPKTFDDEVFAFYGTTLSGQPQQRERWKRAVQAVNGALGEAIGSIYVQRHFPPASKEQMRQLVENLRTAYGQRIDQVSWMSAETKVVAREKLATFRPKIGYPDRWRDYSGLEVRANDAFGNAQRQAIFDWNHDLERLGRPTDKDEWFMTPQTVNAYYNPVFNEIVFPAAILQPPFFDANADPAVNYGAIGGVIGHEMGHGFDDQGAKSDAQGVLRDWWNASDVAAFTQVTDRLVAQYDAFTSARRHQRQWPPDARRKHRRQWRPASVASRLHALTRWPSRRQRSTASPAISASSSAGRKPGARSFATLRCAIKSSPTRTRRRSIAATARCGTWIAGTKRSTSNRAMRSIWRRPIASRSGRIQSQRQSD